MKKVAEAQTVTLVVFGISGDLSRRYILPALAVLKEAGRLPKNFGILGLSRRDVSAKQILDKETARLASHLTLRQIGLTSLGDYKALKSALPKTGQVMFYFAVPPLAVTPIVKMLAKARLNGPKTKLLLEKPFGYDSESAKELVQAVGECFSEPQIYRIDHYMAKEMSQNIAVFLGSNALFRDVWNNQFIDSIDILAAEKIGIEGRTQFYESTGALRDLVQSHLMNLAALTLMRPCSSLFEFAELPIRRLEALKALLPVDPKSVSRAQYQGYKKEVKNPDSAVETFCSLKLYSSEPRWKGVPITLTTGKNLDQKLTEVRVSLKKTDVGQTNSLVLRIQPEEGIEIDLWAKQPGYDRGLRRLPLKFSYAEGADRLPNAYEQVIVDAIRSDQSLFASSAEVLETWRILDPVIKDWNSDVSPLKTYKPGSSLETVLSNFV